MLNYLAALSICPLNWKMSYRGVTAVLWSLLLSAYLVPLV